MVCATRIEVLCCTGWIKVKSETKGKSAPGGGRLGGFLMDLDRDEALFGLLLELWSATVERLGFVVF